MAGSTGTNCPWVPGARWALRSGESLFYRGMDWSAIEKAVELVRSGGVKRVDGEGWSVYAVGAVVRIDLK